MMVDDPTKLNDKELVYDIEKDIDYEKSKKNPQGLRPSGESNSTVTLNAKITTLEDKIINFENRIVELEEKLKKG